MSLLRDSALDFRKASVVKPTYRMSRILQNTGGPEVRLSTNGTSESVFDLPSKCMSLSRSYLHFDLYIPESTTNGVFTKVWTNGLNLVNRIELRTRSGTQIVDVNNADVYYRATSAYTTKLPDMTDADTPRLNAPLQKDRTTVQNAMVARNNSAAANVSVAGASNPARLVDGAYVANSISYTEPQYFAVASAASDGGKAGDVWLNVAIPLSEFKGTFLSLPQDSYFPEVIQLRIQWSQIDKVGFYSTSGTTTGTVSSLSAGVKIENLSFYQALEVDPDVCNDLIRKVNAGMSQTTPYIYSYREAHNATNYNRQLRFNQSHGKNLLRVIHCNVHGTEGDATNIQLDNSTDANGDGNEVVSFYTSLDNLRLSEIDIRSGQHAEDYAFMKPQIEGSCVQDRSMYNYNRIWSDSFDGQKLCDTPQMDDVENGLPLTGVERLWSINQTNNGAADRVNYVFAVTQKTLTQSNGQILML